MRSSTRSAKRSKLVFLFGPTASGKTALTESIFNKGFQIINADSVQVYRHLDIGSAKPSSALMARIPHHLVDLLDPWEQYSVGTFIKEADRAACKILAEGDIPLLAGGTAYYFKHFLFGLSEAPVAEQEVRKRVEAELHEKGAAALHAELEEVDPVSAGRISVNDAYRITRALEVWYQSGRPLSSFTLPDTPRNGMDPLIIGLERPKEELNARIAKRVDLMFESGLLDEIATLMRMGADTSWPGMQGIGYREFFSARERGCSTLSSIKREIVQDSRRYAKRQYTFFRSFENVHWMDPDDEEGIRALLDDYLEG